MSSVEQIKKQIKSVTYLYNTTKNPTSKADFMHQLRNLKKELKAAEAREKQTVKSNPVQQQQPKKEEKEFVNDINRGKVAEPGSNIPDNKSEDKKEEKKDDNKNQNNNNNKKN